MPQAKIGVIGGSGLYGIDGLTDIEEVNIDTPFGKPSDTITIGRLEGVGIATTRLVVIKAFESLPGFFR